MNILGHLLIVIKVLLFGGSIVLQPSSATLTSKYQLFMAPSGSKIEAINDLATLNLQTDELERIKMTQLISTNYKDIANHLSLTSINAFLILDGKKICQLKFVGFSVSETNNYAIYRCDDRNISGMKFSGILMGSPNPIKVKSVRWNNAGK